MINQESRRRNSKKRGVAQLNAALDNNLLAYAAAASAAGVSLLALAQPAQAKIVYTPTNVEITTTVTLDLNHDGITDFSFNRSATQHTSSAKYKLDILAQGRNGVQGYAAVLGSGVLVGPKQKFQTGAQLMVDQTVRCTHTSTYHCETGTGGGWKNITRRYLGLKFFIHGKAHYGWARLNVTVAHYGIYALLTGYAYETIANKAILTGKTKGNENEDRVSSVEPGDPSALNTRKSGPASLGLLARGAVGLDVWRKRDLIKK